MEMKTKRISKNLQKF